MPDASFDIVVIGNELAGLVLASLCSRAGYTVLVVGHEARPATYSYEGCQVFRRLPLVAGLESSPVIRETFRDVGLVAELRNRPRRLDPTFSVITTHHRFDVTSRPEQVESELRREFGDRALEIQSFLQSLDTRSSGLGEAVQGLPLLPESGFWAKRRLRKYLAKSQPWQESQTAPEFPLELHFSSPLAALAAFQMRLASSPVNPTAAHRGLLHAAWGAHEMAPGGDGLTQLFLQRIQATGGQVWSERKIELVTMKRRKAREVIVQRPRREVSAKLVIGACHFRSFFELVPQEQQDASFHSLIKSCQPSHVDYVLNVGVRQDVLPEALTQHVLLSLYPEQQHTGPNTLRMHVARPDESAPNRPAVLTVAARIPASQLPLHSAQFRELNERILSSIEWVVPFLREKLLWTHSPYLTLDPETGAERLDPAELQEVFDQPHDGCLGLSALPARSGYKNMIYIGDHYLGALGLEGQFLAAQQAFAWVRDRIRLKRFLGK